MTVVVVVVVVIVVVVDDACHCNNRKFPRGHPMSYGKWWENPWDGGPLIINPIYLLGPISPFKGLLVRLKQLGYHPRGPPAFSLWLWNTPWEIHMYFQLNTPLWNKIWISLLCQYISYWCKNLHVFPYLPKGTSIFPKMEVWKFGRYHFPNFNMGDLFGFLSPLIFSGCMGNILR